MNNQLPEKPPGRPMARTPFVPRDRQRMPYSPGGAANPSFSRSPEPSLEDLMSNSPKPENDKVELSSSVTLPEKDEPGKVDFHLDVKKDNLPKEPDHKEDRSLDIKINEHSKEPKLKENKHPDVPIIEERPMYDYPEKLNLAEKTGDAIDKSLQHLSHDYLADGEARRSAWLRPVFPIALGFGAGVLKPVADMVGNISQAAVVTSLLSPAVSLLRRVTGENAFSQFARFAKRRNEGLIGKLLFGGEARVLKSLYLREDRDMRQLLRLKDQGADLKSLSVGNKTRISNLIASGFMAEMKAQMIAEHDIKLSDRDNEKINRMHEAYNMAKNLFYAKIPTSGQQEKFLYYDLPVLMTKKERALWAKQTVGIAGIGVLKTTVLVTMGHIFTAKNITDFAKGVGDTMGAIGGWKDHLITDVFQPAMDSIGHTIDDIGKGIIDFKDHTIGPAIDQAGRDFTNWKDHLSWPDFSTNIPPTTNPPVTSSPASPTNGPDFSEFGKKANEFKDWLIKIPQDIGDWVNNALNPSGVNTGIGGIYHRLSHEPGTYRLDQFGNVGKAQ